MPKHCHLIEIHAPVEKVHGAFVSVEGIKGWWTQNAVLFAASPKTYSVRFGSEHTNKMQVLSESAQEIRWQCVEGRDEWVGTTLNFQFESKSPHQSILRFQHDGWRSESDFFAFCNTIWGYYMESVKSFCESGKGTPAKKV